MHHTGNYFLTRKQYRDLTGESRQSVHNKIARKTLKVRIAEELVPVERIVLTPEEFDIISPKTQVRLVDSVNDQE